MDGTGKSTIVRLLKRELGKRLALYTYEPGGTPHAEKIRKVLLTHGAGKRDAVTDFFLFWAARSAHVKEAIIPALQKGKVVISDRFDSSTYAFQVYAEGRKDLERAFWDCRKAVLGKYVPDAYIILDMMPEAAMRRRIKDNSRAVNTFDKQSLAYHARVRAGLKKFKPGSKVYVVNSDRSVKETYADVWRIVKRIVG